MEVLREARDAARVVNRAPGFTALAILILASGIGASTLMFSLVHTALLRTLPFEDPERVVWMYNLRTERDRAPLSVPDVEDYRSDATTLTALAVFTNWTANLTGVGSPERLEGVRVSGNFFELLGVAPLLGRPLLTADEEQQARVAVLTHGLWIRRFGGDGSIVGKGISLNGATYLVAGVLPPGFMFPFREAELAVPLALPSDPRRADRGANFLRAIARLGPGVTLSEARQELNLIARRLQRLYPAENARKTGISLYPLHSEIVRDYRAILWTLFASVGVLLAVGCGNLTNLLLVRAAGRQTEFAVRLSLGASRGRLARLLLMEAALLAAAGAAGGIGLAALGLSAWRAWGPANFPRMSAVGLNQEVVLFACGVAGLTALACGALPAWFASHHIADALRGATRAFTASRRQAAIQRIFVTAQIAAATVLLIGMTVVAHGFARLERVSPGFTSDQTLSVQLSLPPGAYASRDALVRFFDALKERLSAVPGVEAAGVVSLLPLSGLLSTMDIAFPDRPDPPPDEVPQAHFRIASPEYFAAAGIPIVAGRAFTDLDRADAQPVAIVSRTLAERHWPGEPAVGRSIQIVQTGGTSRPYEVVGVVSDVKHFTMDAPSTADLYLPLHQMPSSQAPLLAARMYWVVRARSSSLSLTQTVSAAVAHVDPAVAASSARSLGAVRSASLGPRRVNLRLLEVFGQVAIVLCGIGIYGVAAFSARAKRRELAIRAAFGARGGDLIIAMLRHELEPVAVGVGIGLVAAFLTTPLVFGWAFETNPRDPLTYAGVALGVLIAAAAACYLPVKRAGATNPAEALQI